MPETGKKNKNQCYKPRKTLKPTSHTQQQYVIGKASTLPNSILKTAAVYSPSECQGHYHFMSINLKALVRKEIFKDLELKSYQHKCFVFFCQVRVFLPLKKKAAKLVNQARKKMIQGK